MNASISLQICRRTVHSCIFSKPIRTAKYLPFAEIDEKQIVPLKIGKKEIVRNEERIE